MKLKDRLRALELLWEINDTVMQQVPPGISRNNIQDGLLELRRIIEQQTRQGSPR